MMADDEGNSEFKFRALSGQGTWSLWLCDLGYEKSSKALHEGLPFPVQRSSSYTVFTSVAAKDS